MMLMLPGWILNQTSCQLETMLFLLSLFLLITSPVWFNSNLKHLLNKIYTLRSQTKSKSSPSSSLLTKLSQLQSTFQAQIQLSKHEYIHSLITFLHHLVYSHLKSLHCSSNCIPHYISFNSYTVGALNLRHAKNNCLCSVTQN